MRLLVAPVLVAVDARRSSAPASRCSRRPQRGLVVGLHKASFVVWLGATGIHVLVYALRLPRLLRSEPADAAARRCAQERSRSLLAGDRAIARARRPSRSRGPGCTTSGGEMTGARRSAHARDGVRRRYRTSGRAAAGAAASSAPRRAPAARALGLPPVAARARSGLRPDRRPEQQAADRLAVEAGRLAVPAARRPPARASRSATRTTPSSPPATAGSSRTRSSTTRSPRSTCARSGSSGRTAAPASPARPPASSRTRTTPTSGPNGTAHRRRHPELPGAPHRARRGRIVARDRRRRPLRARPAALAVARRTARRRCRTAGCS